MELEAAIRTRRTHKVFGPEPVTRAVVEELLELARWAPNHGLTEPWRFRVLGPESFERLVTAGEPSERSKLGRAPRSRPKERKPTRDYVTFLTDPALLAASATEADAGERTRTSKSRSPPGPKPGASASSATPASRQG